MTDTRCRDRQFNDEEVALIIKRAAELQQTEQAEQEPASSMSLSEVEQIAREAGIDPGLIRRAAQGLDRPEELNRPSAFAGAPTRIVFERVVDGEIPVDDFEHLINDIRRTFGENGAPSVLGKSMAWSSTVRGGRRRAVGRQVDVTIVARGGVTTIRVEEELRNLAGGLFGGIMGGGGGGTAGIAIGLGMGVFQSLPIGFGLWAATIAGSYGVARAIFGRTAAARERELRELASRLEEQVAESLSVAPPGAQLSAGSPRSLAPGSSDIGGA